MTLSVGLLSTARINDAILIGAAGSDAVEVVAVSSRDPERARTYAAEKGLERAYGSYEELLASDVDAVYIALPNALHVEWAHKALAAGKHVLVEKPLTRKPEEVDPLFDAAEQAGRVVMEAYAWRHAPQGRRIAELVADGAVGELRLVRGCFRGTMAADDVRMVRALGGGALLDVGCYPVGSMRLLAGEPERVEAQQVLGGDGVDVRFAATLRFANDVLGVFDCSFDEPYHVELEVVGSEGILNTRDPWLGQTPELTVRRGSDVEAVEVERPDIYAEQWDGFARAVTGERSDVLDRVETRAQARTLDALLRAAETGVAVTL
jgi:D-xylose 1-dehydrogenase (NADP+, D-xylono-1,5-lactone-forming)